MTGAGLGRLPCVSSFRSCTSSRFLLAPLIARALAISCSGMSIGAGGAIAFADAFALALVLGTVATKGCSTDGGAGVWAGRAGAALAVTTGGLGATTSMPFVVLDRSAVTAAEAEAMNAFLSVFRILEAVDLTVDPWSIIRAMRVLASPPDLACATAAPSAFARSTVMACSIGDGVAGVTGSYPS